MIRTILNRISNKYVFTSFAMRIPGHVQPVGRPCGTWMHYAMRDVKDMGQQMGYRSLE